MLRHRFAFLVLVALSSTALAACSGDPDNPNPSSSGTGGAGGTGGTGSTGGAGGTGGTGGTGGVGGTGGGTVACTGYTTIPQTECDVLAQDCKLPTQSCRPVEGGTGTDCFSSTGVKAAGSPCADTTECQKGMFCINAVCSPACCPANEKQFCGSAKCNIELAFDDASKSWVKVCNFAKTCTLFTPGTCPAGQECHLQDFAQEIAVCALPAGQQSDEGGACMYINACHDSQVCEGNSDVCRYNCLINGWQNKKAGEGGCPQGQTCHPAPPATTYGICGP